MASIRMLAKEWLRLDQDEETRSEIEQLLEQQNSTELEHLLSTRLVFSTASLRAQIGAGYARLNSLTIIQTSQGLGEYIIHEGIAPSGVVVGHDARHNSQKFAELAAAAFMAKGIPVWWYENIVHTPMVPFAVKTFKAAAGVMITASHNPKQDNGYKVYGSNACQINSPVDSYIAASIIDNLKPEIWKFNDSSPLLKPILQQATEDYMDTLFQYVKAYPNMPHQCPAFVYTPMHGVGYSPMTAITQKLNIWGKMFVVHDQAQPDADFPTVRFPNPEEYGALDLAKATADREGITLLIANDPDADRFAVAEKVDGHWKQFTGDQVGVLFAHFLREDLKNQTSHVWMLTTAVSSQMLSVIADGDFSVGETLTGFKWLGNRALDLVKTGEVVKYAYEEALGYMFPEIVHDKDGIAAAVIFLCACATWGSPWAKLQQLYEIHGYFETMNTYWKSPDLVTTGKIFEHVRRLGTPYPTHVAGKEVLRWRDLTVGYDSSTADNVPELPSSSESQMITCWLQGIRFTIRASGTEPKIKIYLECHNKNREAAKASAAEVLSRISKEWFGDPTLIIEQKYAHLAVAT
ncbi:phosphoglucomutase, partial [Lecanoromycetidae sp. Uapishka_2]